MSRRRQRNWPRPPPSGYTAADLDLLQGLPPHTELIDGSLVFAARQNLFHSLACDVLEEGLRRATPADWRVRRQMSVILGSRQRPEPDLVVVRAEADVDDDQTWYPAEAVALAVEVVSPESEVRDRERKPQLYAGAGIRHFWRVENGGGGGIVLYVYELDPATRAYALTGICHDRVRLTVPFGIDIDLTEVSRF